MGCWAIGGPFWAGDQPFGWGDVDDAESERAIRRALELGVTFFDTADVYGTGHSESVLARAIGGHRGEVVIATKWGNTYDEEALQLTGADASPAYLRRALEKSLERLGSSYIDLYQLHIGDLEPGPAEELLATLEDLVEEGKVRWYGWSTDLPDRAELWVKQGAHFTAVQHDFSVLANASEMLALCQGYDLASIARGPLAMGLLTGKFSATSTLGADDVRGVPPPWMRYFGAGGRPDPGLLSTVAAVREALTVGGRTLAQGALAYLWARSDKTIPVPGCRTVAQVEENAAALGLGALSPSELAEVESSLSGLRRGQAA